MSTPSTIWMTTAEAAQTLDTDGSVIRQWLKRGLLKGRKRSSGGWLVDAASVYHLRAQRQARLAAVYAALDSLPVAPPTGSPSRRAFAVPQPPARWPLTPPVWLSPPRLSPRRLPHDDTRPW